MVWLWNKERRRLTRSEATVKKEDERVAPLKEKVRVLQSKNIRKQRSTCKTCTRATHDTGKCPGKKVECYGCGQYSHFKGSAACRAQGKDKT